VRVGAGDAFIEDTSAGRLGAVLERLTDGSHVVSPAGPFELLTLRLAGF